MLRFRLRFRHECPFSDLSRAHPSVLIAHWCNRHFEVVEAHGETEALRSIQRALCKPGRGAQVLESPERGDGALRVALDCICLRGKGTEERIEANGGIPLRPIIYKDGWEHYRIMAVGPDAPQRILAELRQHGEAEITTKRRSRSSLVGDNFLLSVDDLLGDLTQRQVNALRAALTGGYYRSPRAVKTEELARRSGARRTTFEEHLRKAENKLLASVAPYIELATQATRTPPPARGR